MNLYYLLWADAIGFEKSKHGHIRNWKPYVLIGITFSQGLNLAAILIFISSWVKARFFLPIDIFPGQIIDSALSGIITLHLPFLIINYLLVFRNKKYEEIVKKYSYNKGKLYIGYFIVSFCLFIMPLIIGFIFSRI